MASLTIQFKGLCLFVREGRDGKPEVRMPRTSEWDSSLQNENGPEYPDYGERPHHMAHHTFLVARTDVFKATDVMLAKVGADHVALPLDGYEVSFKGADEVREADRNAGMALLDALPDFAGFAPAAWRGRVADPSSLSSATTAVVLSGGAPSAKHVARLEQREWQIREWRKQSPTPKGRELAYRIDWTIEGEELELVARRWGGGPKIELQVTGEDTIVIGCLPNLQLESWMRPGYPGSGNAHYDLHFHEYYRLLGLEAGERRTVRVNEAPVPFRTEIGAATIERCSVDGSCESYQLEGPLEGLEPLSSAGTPTCFSAVI